MGWLRWVGRSIFLGSLLVAGGAAGARPLIREELARQGFRELRDFWCGS